MQLYEVSGLGFHTPLSSGEIARLFRAGQLDRDAKCKAVDAQSWRTVDELFPLLKYDTPAIGRYRADEEYSTTVTRRHLVGAVAATLLVALSLFAVFLLYERSIVPAPRRQAPAVHAPQVRTAPYVSNAPRNSATPYVSTTPAIARPSRPSVAVPHAKPRVPSAPASMQAQRAPASNLESDRRFLEERRRREQEQRDQAVAAERLREKNAREAAEKQRDAGKDTILPLDQYGSVYVGGSWVSVKIHDNDVTSFDAWVNGAFYDDVRKQKGITQSGTDETLIYRSGGASLYYVWELSGKLNHCRLRVREN